MSLTGGVQWWEKWQLEVLVLSSLFLQYFLFLAALVRKKRVPRWFRALVWLAYQGCDVVAIYALATLFNRHKKDDDAAGGWLPASRRTAHLDTLSAPILLLHLGGQDGITAYCIEDNELWRRHFLTAASQIAVAVYVFWKSWWSDDVKLLRAAILLFVPGIIKCLEKPLALKNATMTSIMRSPDSRLEEAALLQDAETAPKEKPESLDQYVRAAKKCFRDAAEQPPERLGEDVEDEPYHLLVDVSHGYGVRLLNLQFMAPKGARRREAHDRVRASLSKAFDRLYTKHRASVGGLLRAAVVLLTFADIGVLTRTHPDLVDFYGAADVVVTYVLLCCTAALEFVTACFVLGSGLPWPDDRADQFNVLHFVARSGGPNKGVRRLASALGMGCGEYVDRVLGTTPPQASAAVTALVHEHVSRGWLDFINSVDTYRQFNDSRGQRTLERERCAAGKTLAWSLRRPFDESVLVWHLATELCYFHHVDTGGDATRISRVVSNYMAYLLVVRPEMLLPGARRGLFTAACREIHKLLKDEPSEKDEDYLLPEEEEEGKKKKPPPPRAKDELARRIIQEVTTTKGSGDGELVRRAWAIVEDLMEFAKKRAEEKTRQLVREAEAREKQEEAERAKKGTPPAASPGNKKEEDNGEQKARELVNAGKRHGDDWMWAVIQGVWVEMLCFSAARCAGTLHAKRLGGSGEYLSHVWLLLSYMGMETPAERMHRSTDPVLLLEGDTGVPPPPPDEDELAQATAVAPVGDERV